MAGEKRRKGGEKRSSEREGGKQDEPVVRPAFFNFYFPARPGNKERKIEERKEAFSTDGGRNKTGFKGV